MMLFYLYLYFPLTSFSSGRERKFWIFYSSPCCHYCCLFFASPRSRTSCFICFLCAFSPFAMKLYSSWEMNICLCDVAYFFIPFEWWAKSLLVKKLNVRSSAVWKKAFRKRNNQTKILSGVFCFVLFASR